MRLTIVVAGIAGMTAVALSAVTSHMGSAHLSPAQVGWIETALKYQIWHSIALLLVACLSEIYDSRLLKIAGYLFMLGIFVFCGSLYLLAATEIGRFGLGTPFGGASFIIAWGLLALAGFRLTSRHQ